MTKQRPSFLQFRSPWFFNPGTVRLPSRTLGLSAEEAARSLVEGKLVGPYILETASERCLYFTDSYVQSVMNLDDPYALVTPYTQGMMAFLLFNPNPRRVTMVGLGGGSLVKFCYRHLPETQITVVEIDDRVIALREDFCIPADDNRLRIVCDDAARYIARQAEQIDVLLVDAFDHVGVAPTLASSDFYEQASRRLTSRGVLVMNFAGAHGRYAAHIDRIRAAFGNIALVPVVAEDNLLLFASRHRIPLPTTIGYQHRAQWLQSRFTLDFPLYLRRICQAPVLVGLSKVRIDAPQLNQLVTRDTRTFNQPQEEGLRQKRID